MKNTNSTLNGEDLKNITSRVIYLRNQILHMTQSEFASVLKMSQTYLSLIESGKKAITKPTIDNILSTFKVNMEWLLFGIGTDDEIFLSTSYTKEYFTKSTQESALSALQNAYQLKNNETDFVKWYLSLSSKERSHFLSCIEGLRNIISTLMCFFFLPHFLCHMRNNCKILFLFNIIYTILNCFFAFFDAYILLLYGFT